MTEVSSWIFRQTYIIPTVDGLLQAAVMDAHQIDAQAGARPTIWPTVNKLLKQKWYLKSLPPILSSMRIGCLTGECQISETEMPSTE